MAIPKKLTEFNINEPTPLEPCKGWSQEADHHFDEKQAVAIMAAFHIKRPLLVRGEPGVGKSQLARAVAAKFGLPLVYMVANERMEPEDLLWSFDDLARLSDVNKGKLNAKEGASALVNKEYLSAGPLWWAIDPVTAEEFEGNRSYAPDYSMALSEECNTEEFLKKPFVLLIDEIDKADRSVPNSLLESLGNLSFRVPYISSAKGSHSNEIRLADNSERSPIIIITSNEEQELPPAFVRRCLVLDMELLPEDLTKRAKSRFEEQYEKLGLNTEIISQAIDALWKVRQNNTSRTYPGQAECFDLLEAIMVLSEIGDSQDKTNALIEKLTQLTYNK